MSNSHIVERIASFLIENRDSVAYNHAELIKILSKKFPEASDQDFSEAIGYAAERLSVALKNKRKNSSRSH